MLSTAHYDVCLTIRPSEGSISVRLQMDCYSLAADANEVQLGLHQSAQIRSVKAVPDARWELRPGSPLQFAPESATLAITPAAPMSAGERLRLELAYDLQLGILQPWEVNRVTAEWVELGLYQPWFPLDPAYPPFTFAVAVEVTEPGYAVTGNGRVRSEGGRWIIESEFASKDLIVMASPQLQEIGSGRIRVICARDEDAALAQAVIDDSEWLLRCFRGWFGEPLSDGLTLALAPRSKGGGYARHGFVVLTPDGLVDPLIRFRYMAHELAHLWWQRAQTSSWQDWLNESFAEYSSILAVRERFGEATAEELLEARRAKLPGLPAIMGLPREHEKAHPTLYAKGCILLHRLEQAMGTAEMMVLLRRLNDESVSDTDAYLRLLGGIGGEGVASKFAGWLRQ